MSRYIKKPEEVEAFEWKCAINRLRFDYPDWFNRFIAEKRKVRSLGWGVDETLYIITTEGLKEAVFGDYIVKDSEGNVYPVKHDVFLKQYDKLDENE